MKMPFGKHQGKEVSEVPRGYLRWLHGGAKLRGPLLWEIEERLDLPHTPEAMEIGFAETRRRIAEMMENMDWQPNAPRHS